MTNSTLTPSCYRGKRYDSAEKALRHSNGAEVKGCDRCGFWHVEKPQAPPSVTAAKKVARDTGFSVEVKLMTRIRAGKGSAADACCEACGIWLGLLEGQCQHIVPRMAGGRGPKAPWWINAVVNSALCCGTPATGCHGRAENRELLLKSLGFWLPSSNDPMKQPPMVPMTLHGLSGGTLVLWRTADGGYSDTAPELVPA